MSDLATRIEQATGADRELDAEIACLVGHDGWQDCFGEPGYEAKHYTVSIDAAMSLVLEGWHTSNYHQGPGGGHWWKLGYIDDAMQHYINYITAEGKAATPALALCAAAIRTMT